MFLKLIRILLPVFIISLNAFAYDDEDSVVAENSYGSLMNTISTSRVSGGDSIIYMYFNFSDSCPNYFYEINTEEKKINLTFVNIRPGIMIKDDTLKQISLGPIKSMHISDLIKDKNEGMVGIRPEYYYVTNVTIDCDPIVKGQESIDIDGKKNTLSIMLRWPKEKREKKRLYVMPHKKRPVLAASLITAGVAGLACGGYFIWKFLGSDDDEDNTLNPVLPVHSGN